MITHLVLGVGAGVALAAGLNLASWVAFSDGPIRPQRDIVLTIPAGTAARIAAGGAAPALPGDLSAVQGDILVLRNEDVVAHRVDRWEVAPGSTLRVPLDRPAAGRFLCSFHPVGSLAVEIRPAPGPLSIAGGIALLGLPIGLVTGAVSWVFGRLDESVAGTAFVGGN
ncbi:MAG: cupredoxin domain-containing protein [Chloroflexota bacterium]